MSQKELEQLILAGLTAFCFFLGWFIGKLILITYNLFRWKTSTIPYGYAESEIAGYFKPIPDELEALAVAESMINREEVTLRDAAYWLHYTTGRYISHVGLKNYVDKNREREE